MEDTVKQRLIDFIEYKKISKNRFETLCGLGKRYVSNISVSIQPDKIKKISLVFPELNVAWLLTGEGDMLRPMREPTQIMNCAQPPTDVVMSREVFNQITRLTEAVASQQQTIDKLVDSLQKMGSTVGEVAE